jgi:hypothetical protein
MTPNAAMEKWLNEKYAPNVDPYQDLGGLIKLSGAIGKSIGPNYWRSGILEASPETFHFSATAVNMNSKDTKRFKDEHGNNVLPGPASRSSP